MSRNVFLSHNQTDKITNRVFSFDSPKAIKSIEYGWLNAIHYMAPHTLAGVGNLCPGSTAPCRYLCLGENSGQAGMVSYWNQINSVRRSRRDKARLFMRRRADYMRHVVRSLELAEIKARKLGMQLCARMNGSTDIAWEGVACERNGIKYRNLMEAFPNVTFVDYTKLAGRFNRPLPVNYHLTFSRSEANEAQCRDLLSRGVNVAVVFGSKDKPPHWQGFATIDGDQHDLRHLDPKGVIGVVVALSPKGSRAKRDKSGFVVR
jgi:hypothetical protein